MNRREMLFAGGLSLLAGVRSFGQSAGAAVGRADVPVPVARLLGALQRNRLPITIGDAPVGAGWEWLVKEASSVRFTLTGEEHGVAETARFSSALFSAL